MSKFKLGNSYYLDKEEFSSVTIDKLWTKLSTYVDENTKLSDVVKLNKDAGVISVTSEGSEPNPIAASLDFEKAKNLKKSVIRIIQLNTEFDRMTKGLKLSTEHVENFAWYNTVAYQAACENKNVEDMNSLFFHESALIDYTKNFKPDEYLSCPYFVMLITFKNSQTVSDHATGNTMSNTYNDMIFVCYDTNLQKIVPMNFSVVNSGTTIDVEDLIRRYNSNISDLATGFTITIEDEEHGKTIQNNFFDFKTALSIFKLISKDELELINFRTFNSLMYDRFISNLKYKLKPITQ